MSYKERQEKISRMEKMAHDYEAQTGRKPSATYMAAIQSQGTFTINDPAYAY